MRVFLRFCCPAFLIALGVCVQQAHAGPIAQWTFESTAPTTAGPFSPEIGTGSALGVHAGTTVYSSPVGNGSAHSFSSTNWLVGDSYRFSVKTAGLTGLTLTFDQTSSNTGPRDFMVETSSNGGATWNNGATYSVLANASPNPFWTSGGSPNPLFSFSFSLPDGITDVRLVDISTNPAGPATGNIVGAAGTDRVDNVTITGVPAPEPSTLVIASVMACAGIGAMIRRGRRG